MPLLFFALSTNNNTSKAPENSKAPEKISQFFPTRNRILASTEITRRLKKQSQQLIVEMGTCHSKPDEVEYDDFFSSIQSEIGYAKSDVVSLSTEIWDWDVSQMLPEHEFWNEYGALIYCGQKEHDQRASEALSVLGKLQEQLDCSLVSGYDSLVGSFNPVTHEYDLETLRAFCLGPLTTYESSCNKVLNI